MGRVLVNTVRTHILIFIYDATLKVPLIISLAWYAHGETNCYAQVRLIDLYPTILDLLSIPMQNKISGISLKPMMNSQNYPIWIPFLLRNFYSVASFRLEPFDLGWRMNGWKYIDAPRAELYDLGTIRQELTNVYSKEKKRADDLKKWLANNGSLESKAVSNSQRKRSILNSWKIGESSLCRRRNFPPPTNR